MQTLTVDLGQRSYPITIGSGALRQATALKPFPPQAVVVTDTTVADKVLDSFLAATGLRDPRLHVFPAGETSKTLDTFARLLDALLEFRLSRDEQIIALGGGVVGDLTGFAAACYMRGIAFVQVPTTLLAQVDSSVGGKTGVNHPRGKNLIGAFHQPSRVICDMDLLETLDEREYRAGLAEIIKSSLILDASFFEWLETNMASLVDRDKRALETAVYRSCQIKASIVARDELEAGVRAFLNLGHTFAHALETAGRYERWLHGEAVAIGLVLAAELSRNLGDFSTAEADRIAALVAAAGLPWSLPEDLPLDRIWELTAHDKKVQSGQRRFVILDRIGAPRVVEVTARSTITGMLDRSATADSATP